MAAAVFYLYYFLLFTSVGVVEGGCLEFANVFRAVTNMVMPTGASDILLMEHHDDSDGHQKLFSCTPIDVHFGGAQFEQVEPVKMLINGLAVPIHLTVGVDGIVRGEGDNDNTVGDDDAAVGVLQIALLKEHLPDGHGHYSVRFEVHREGQAPVVLECSLYYWDLGRHRLVLSDIDGTITRGDKGGMLIGQRWVFPSVAQLYNRIAANGYKFVYLSARPTGMGAMTKRFLEQLRLPPGPLFLSRRPFMESFKKALKEPHKAKQVWMRHIKVLNRIRLNQGLDIHFWAVSTVNANEDHNPFVAGFGNQHTDLLAYQAAGVPLIFIVNNKSWKVKLHQWMLENSCWEPSGEMNSYREMAQGDSAFLETYFPPLALPEVSIESAPDGGTDPENHATEAGEGAQQLEMNLLT